MDEKKIIVVRTYFEKDHLGKDEPAVEVNEVNSFQAVDDVPMVALFSTLNTDSCLYKKFYSKLPPKLKEEFEVMTGAFLNLLYEFKLNLPEEYYDIMSLFEEKLDERYKQYRQIHYWAKEVYANAKTEHR